MSNTVRNYSGGRYKVVTVGKPTLFSGDSEFEQLEEALDYQKELQLTSEMLVVVNEVVLDKTGEFVGWRRLEKR